MSMPVDVFFSYSHKDASLRDELATHLAVLSRQKVIRGWHDRQIGAGEDWRGAIDGRLNAAGLILLLVSADYLASDYCYDAEMMRALERWRAGDVWVVPIILRDCDWTNAPFAELRALPSGAKAVTSWTNRDEAWSDVVRGLRAQIETLATRAAAPAGVPRATAGEPVVAATPAQHFFISYRHGGDAERLAHRMRDALHAGGAAVFLDIDLQVGTDWAIAIRERIEASDVFVVMLSADAVSSEMVQTEVQIAYRNWRRNGRPRILPVRVGYDGPLDYELDARIGRLQYVAWRGGADDVRVIEAIRRAAQSSAGPPETTRVTSLRSEDLAAPPRSPAPGFDPRIASAPGGTLPPHDPLYVERQCDRDAEKLAALNGQTLVIKGARQRGKSSLVVRYLARCSERGKHIALIDFEYFSAADFDNHVGFLSSLAATIKEVLGLDGPEPVIKRQTQMVTFLQRTVLERLGGPVVLAIDEADRVLGRTYQADFFGMLRGFHNNRANPQTPVWCNLDLALVISTEPYLLIQDGAQSPFNVGLTIQLDSFTLDQCKALNQKYPRPLQDTEVEDLFDLLRGHPFLTRLAHYRLLFQQVSLDTLLRTAHEPGGPFGDHLRALLSKLSEDPKLLPALKQAIQTGSIPDAKLADRLSSAGLIRRERDRYNPANLVYAKFFKNAR